MLDAAISKKASLFGRRGLWSGVGRAGPRRLLIIGVSGLALAAVLAVVTLDGKSKPIVSSDARMQAVNPNPGGLNSDPEQNALALRADDAAANAALATGTSYTPPMAPSVPVVLDTPPPPSAASAAPASAAPASVAPLPAQHFPLPSPAPPTPPPPLIQPADAPIFPPPLPGTAQAAAEQPPGVQSADNGGASDPQQQSAYTAAINGLFSQWDGRPPVTDVVLPPPPSQSTGAAAGQTLNSGGTAQSGPGAAQSGSEDAGDGDAAATSQQVLIPAGRGIFAHPVLALSSDATSPVVMQADSGPIAGDRMIGNFSRENDRLIIHINQIIHNGQAISCDGVVIAPDTMEAAVASGVDPHYIARFLLPAAAAFVQGLGNALATTSNSTQVLSPFGGATTTTNLNFHQQLGVAAGVAAAQIGSTLDQDAPKGPTISLDANVAVGVMFLTDVKVPEGS